MIQLDLLTLHAKRMQEAVLCLCRNEHRVAALMLFYATIDQMAWLTIPGEADVRGPDFMRWVDDYMPLQEDEQLAKLTSGDLWGARCGYLHTAGPSSSSLRNKVAKNLIAYSYGPVMATSNFDGTLAVRFEALVAAFLTAVLRFKDRLDSDSVKSGIAAKKLPLMSQDWGI